MALWDTEAAPPQLQQVPAVRSVLGCYFPSDSKRICIPIDLKIQPKSSQGIAPNYLLQSTETGTFQRERSPAFAAIKPCALPSQDCCRAKPR